MTVIAAYTDSRTVWMASDRERDFDGTRAPAALPKINRIPVGDTGHALIGFAGSSVVSQLTRHCLHLTDAPPNPDDTNDLDAWAHAVARAISDIATERPAALNEHNQLRATGLLAYAGRIWGIHTDVACLIDSPYYAIGSGGELALGALHALHGDTIATLGFNQVLPALFRACHAAHQWDANCTPPFDIDTAPMPNPPNRA